MASRYALALAVAEERIRCLEATVALLQEALLAAASSPVNVSSDSTGAGGPGFKLLSQQLLANADDAPPAPPVDITPRVTWFRADGGDPAEKVAS